MEGGRIRTRDGYERLLTGTKPEPTYVVEKPFRPDTLKALISQALFFHAPRSGN